MFHGIKYTQKECFCCCVFFFKGQNKTFEGFQKWWNMACSLLDVWHPHSLSCQGKGQGLLLEGGVLHHVWEQCGWQYLCVCVTHLFNSNNNNNKKPSVVLILECFHYLGPNMLSSMLEEGIICGIIKWDVFMFKQLDCSFPLSPADHVRHREVAIRAHPWCGRDPMAFIVFPRWPPWSCLQFWFATQQWQVISTETQVSGTSQKRAASHWATRPVLQHGRCPWIRRGELVCRHLGLPALHCLAQWTPSPGTSAERRGSSQDPRSVAWLVCFKCE